MARQPRGVARRVAEMTHGFGEFSSIEPLVDGSIVNTMWLARDKVRILEVIAVILAIRTLMDIKRTAGIILEDRVDGPSIQKVPRCRVPILIQLGKIVQDGEREVIAPIGQPVRPYFLESALGLVALLVRAAALVIPQFGEGIGRGQDEAVRKPMLKMNEEAVVKRGSMEIEHAHLAKGRIGTICLYVSAGGLRRTDIEVEQRRVLMRSLHPNIGFLLDICFAVVMFMLAACPPSFHLELHCPTTKIQASNSDRRLLSRIADR